MSVNFGSNETLGRSPSVHNNGLLLAQEPRNRRGSTASIRSSHSAHTIREDNPNEEIKQKIRKRQTCRVKIHKPSRWACLLGFLFGPRRTADRTMATVEEVDDESDPIETFDQDESPYIKTLFVISRIEGVKPIPKRCAFDTGCYMGNIVSLEFALKLGYKEAKFKPLKAREMTGESSSGHPIHPKGAVLLSWYHGTSPQFSNMRFLVVEDYHFDLLIGAESMYHHKMLSPIIFSHHQRAGVSVVAKTTDPELEQLSKKLHLRKDERDNIGLQRKAAIKADPTDHSFDEKYKKAKARVIMKELQIQEHKLKADLIREPWNEDYKKLLQDTQAKLKENDGKVKKSKTPSSSITTDTSIGDTSKKTTGIEIKVQAPSRAGTSLSPFAKSATRSMRK